MDGRIPLTYMGRGRGRGRGEGPTPLTFSTLGFILVSDLSKFQSLPLKCPRTRRFQTAKAAFSYCAVNASPSDPELVPNEGSIQV